MAAKQTTLGMLGGSLCAVLLSCTPVNGEQTGGPLDDLFGEPTNWISPGDSLNRRCEQLFAPPMIGDSLGVPIAIGDANRQVLHTQHFSKVADHNSPIPRTRVFASYQFFNGYDSVNTLNDANDDAADLQVYKLGFEKTVFDGNGSVEFILPMLQTISPVNTPTGAAISDELGRIAFGYKQVLCENDGILFSAGMRVEAPTEDDILFGGGQIDLGEWQLQPWFGFIAQGENDTFLHCFISGRYTGSDFETTIEEIFEEIDEGFDEVLTAGSTEAQHLFMVDIGVGKWIHLNSGPVRAIVPTLELHYMHASSADSPFGLSGGIFGDNVDVLNLTAGATAYVGDRSALQVGLGVPLHSNQSTNPGGVNGTIDVDQFYDWELLVHWTIFSR